MTSATVLLMFTCLFAQISLHMTFGYFAGYQGPELLNHPADQIHHKLHHQDPQAQQPDQPDGFNTGFKSGPASDVALNQDPSVHVTETDVPDDYIPELDRDISVTAVTKAKVSFAATERALLSHNGVFVSRTTQYRESRSATLMVRQGDVLGIHAHSEMNWHGIIVDIQIGNHHYVTGRNAFRSYSTYMATYTHTNINWDARNSTNCMWVPPQVASRPSTDIFSKTFPFKSGAKYVWVPRIAPNDNIQDMLLRYKFGGERCAHKTPTPSPSASPSSSPVFIQPPTVAARCNCTQSEQRDGDCYHFGSERAAELGSGFCKHVTCAPKFECISNDGLSSNKEQTQCMTKYSWEEVRVARQRGDGRFICEKVRLNPPKPYYMPYV